MKRSELLCLDLVEKKNSGIYLAQRSKGLWELLRQVGVCVGVSRPLTCTPKIPNMMKKAQQMTTMLPMGFSDDMRVSTTSFRPGALLMTLKHSTHCTLSELSVCVCLYVCVPRQFTADGDACSNAPSGQEPQAITLSDNHIPSFCLTCTTFRPDSHLELLAVCGLIFFFFHVCPLNHMTTDFFEYSLSVENSALLLRETKFGANV